MNVELFSEQDDGMARHHEHAPDPRSPSGPMCRRNVPDYPVPDMADVELVDVMRALSDPIRLHIVRVLADGEPHAKTMDGWGVDVTKSTMSHHFKALREAGITRTIVDGRAHAIQLRRAELDERFPGLVAALTS